MPLTWKEQALVGNEAIAAGISAISTLATTAQTALTAVRTAASLVPPVVDATALAADAVASTLASGLVGLLADGLDTGIYSLTIYPQRVDYGRARLREALIAKRVEVAAMEAELDKLQAAAQRSTGSTLRGLAGSVEARRALVEAARAELFRQEKDDYFAAADLAAEFSFESFMSTLSASIADTGDGRRPQFTAASVVTGIVVTVGVDTLVELARVCAALAAWANNPGLTREAAALDRLVTAPVRPRLSMPPEPPDWLRLSIAQAFGIDGQVAALRELAASVGKSGIVSSSATTDAIRAWVTGMAAHVEAKVTVLQNLIAGIAALAALNAKANVLLVPPVDGEKSVAVLGAQGGPVTRMPNITAGTAGFLNAVSTAAAPPSSRWVVGMVFLFGAPLGVDVVDMTAEVASSAAVSAAIGSCRQVYDLLRVTFG